ncbi:MAG: hypothetical protein M0C28_17955 [Candidatus Moduliflexus flocculans]|nr:hypothetical protein [Candidatus Moduliflexus flocculans]
MFNIFISQIYKLEPDIKVSQIIKNLEQDEKQTSANVETPIETIAPEIQEDITPPLARVSGGNYSKKARNSPQKLTLKIMKTILISSAQTS